MHDRELCLEDLRQIEWGRNEDRQPFPGDTSSNRLHRYSGRSRKIRLHLHDADRSRRVAEKSRKITGGTLLSKYPEVDWKKAMGMRDIITHHYADLHAETVFYTCKRKIPPLLETVRKITQDLQ